MKDMDIPAARKLHQDLLVMREKMHDVGLNRTAHEMASAVNIIGFEVAHHVALAQRGRVK